jgi:hypothetical protein
VTVKRVRVSLIIILLAALFIELLCVILPVRSGWIESEESTKLVVRILSIYAAPLGIILGGVFADSGREARRANDIEKWLALTVVSGWNLLLLWRCLFFYLVVEQNAVKHLNEYLDAVTGASTFLIAGALAYFFTKKK